ncbi:MAG TPA: ATP-binding protein [Trebonia sp.]
MLLSFRFANHRSFRDEQQLNLTPVYGDDGNPTRADAPSAVPVVGIFGANASGKSNVVNALSYASDMVGRSDRDSEPGRGTRRLPFRLDPAVAAEPSSYAVDLLVDGVRTTYGFSLDDTQILEEWLYSYPLRRRRVVFERNREEFNWGEESRRSDVRKLTDIVAPTALFLSVAARFDSRSDGGRDETAELLHSVFTWLWQRVSRDVHLLRYRDRNTSYVRWLEDPALRTSIVELLHGADVGLLDVFAKQPASNEGGFILDKGSVHFRHAGAVDDVLFDVDEESSGTLRLLELTARAVPVLNEGGLFLVDEIDASLHPLLTASLVNLFQSSRASERGAQLMFTTHDATLLGSIDGEDVLRRDQVWFTSKREDGSSELFPLAEFKPRRQGENRQKRYLNGSYGAVPELSMRLFEQAVTSRTDAGAE